MGYIQRWVEEISEWANGTIEGNGVWKMEGVARRFKTAQCVYIDIHTYMRVESSLEELGVDGSILLKRVLKE
jgi:hypothetical protein